MERRVEISNFEQSDLKSLKDSWERFKLLLKRSPNHDMDNMEKIQHFTQGLKVYTKILLDASVGSTMKMKN